MKQMRTTVRIPISEIFHDGKNLQKKKNLNSSEDFPSQVNKKTNQILPNHLPNLFSKYEITRFSIILQCSPLYATKSFFLFPEHNFNCTV